MRCQVYGGFGPLWLCPYSSPCRAGSAGRPLVQLSDDAGRFGVRLIREADQLPNDTLRPRRGLSVEVPRPVAEEIGDGAVRQRTMTVLDPHLGQINNVDEAQVVLRAACRTKDSMEVGEAQSWDDAAATALANLGGDATRPARVRALAQELSTAEGRDIVGELAVFSACEIADQP